MYEPVALNTEVNTLVEFGLLEEPVQSVFAWFLVHAKVYLFCDVFFCFKAWEFSSAAVLPLTRKFCLVF